MALFIDCLILFAMTPVASHEKKKTRGNDNGEGKRERGGKTRGEGEWLSHSILQ